jgi:hypothetical protein
MTPQTTSQHILLHAYLISARSLTFGAPSDRGTSCFANTTKSTTVAGMISTGQVYLQGLLVAPFFGTAVLGSLRLHTPRVC